MVENRDQVEDIGAFLSISKVPSVAEFNCHSQQTKTVRGSTALNLYPMVKVKSPRFLSRQNDHRNG